MSVVIDGLTYEVAYAIAPLVGGALIAGASSLLGGLFGGASAKAQNEKNRAWQEHMRATQYQATVADMKKAGINPMMLASGGALSQGMTPGGVQSEQQLSEGITSAGPKAIEAAVAGAQLKNINSATAKNQADAAKVEQDTVMENLLFEISNPGYALGPHGSSIRPGDRPTGKPRGQLDNEQVAQMIAESMARANASNASAEASNAAAAASHARAELDKAGLSKIEMEKWFFDNAKALVSAVMNGQNIVQVIRSLLGGQ